MAGTIPLLLYRYHVLQGFKSFLSSSATEVAPARSVPPAPGPVPVPEPPLRNKRSRVLWWVIVLAVVAAIVALVLRGSSPSGKTAKQANGDAARTAIVEQKDFIRRLRAHGIVEAVESRAIAAPRPGRIEGPADPARSRLDGHEMGPGQHSEDGHPCSD